MCWCNLGVFDGCLDSSARQSGCLVSSRPRDQGPLEAPLKFYSSGGSGSSSLLAVGFLPVSLYLRAFVSMISCSKSLRNDLKTFLLGSPVLSVSSWRVNSFPSVFKV